MSENLTPEEEGSWRGWPLIVRQNDADTYRLSCEGEGLILPNVAGKFHAIAALRDHLTGVHAYPNEDALGVAQRAIKEA